MTRTLYRLLLLFLWTLIMPLVFLAYLTLTVYSVLSVYLQGASVIIEHGEVGTLSLLWKSDFRS